MECPQCTSDALKVIDSRDVDAESAIRRRRECESCAFRFTTYERVEAPHLWIVKKDGRREQFDRAKLARGIWRATEKRPLSESAIEQTISQIETDLRGTGDSEVVSTQVGDLTMKHLKELDQIAYIRFAAVYRAFTDLDELQQEVDKLEPHPHSATRPKPRRKNVTNTR